MLSPEYKVKQEIINLYYQWEQLEPINLGSDEEVETLYQELYEKEDLWDAICAVREGDVETDIDCDYSRHYESKSVAMKCVDGTWVGWTYWYGGGKHGDPESIDWIEYAYDLDVKEEEKLVVVREFTKKENKDV